MAKQHVQITLFIIIIILEKKNKKQSYFYEIGGKRFVQSYEPDN